jgi:phosphoglycolate phosphatase-like HAD superfamily hydrolase
VLIAGDTAARAKPFPDPLQEAARRLGREPSRCVYVGDDVRDMQAGRAAGMATAAAGWGYLGLGARIEDWGADVVLARPEELLNWLQLA